MFELYVCLLSSPCCAPAALTVQKPAKDNFSSAPRIAIAEANRFDGSGSMALRTALPRIGKARRTQGVCPRSDHPIFRRVCCSRAVGDLAVVMYVLDGDVKLAVEGASQFFEKASILTLAEPAPAPAAN